MYHAGQLVRIKFKPEEFKSEVGIFMGHNADGENYVFTREGLYRNITILDAVYKEETSAKELHATKEGAIQYGPFCTFGFLASDITQDVINENNATYKRVLGKYNKKYAEENG